MWLQNENPDWSRHTPWWGLIRKRLMAVVATCRPERHEASYRPELHYMRGPGPKWREKHARPPFDQLGWRG
jgi:hypothetical protein